MKVISLELARKSRNILKGDPEYLKKVKSMDKIQLLEEMVRFQKERSAVSQLTVTMMVQGQILFRELEANAETPELKILARSYHRHLKLELETKLQAAK